MFYSDRDDIFQKTNDLVVLMADQLLASFDQARRRIEWRGSNYQKHFGKLNDLSWCVFDKNIPLRKIALKESSFVINNLVADVPEFVDAVKKSMVFLGLDDNSLTETLLLELRSVLPDEDKRTLRELLDENNNHAIFLKTDRSQREIDQVKDSYNETKKKITLFVEDHPCSASDIAKVFRDTLLGLASDVLEIVQAQQKAFDKDTTSHMVPVLSGEGLLKQVEKGRDHSDNSSPDASSAKNTV